MRSVAAGSFQRLSNPEALWEAWLICRQGKRRQPRIAAFELDADSHILRLHRELRAGIYRPSPYQLKLVQDPKRRLIAAPAIRDRIVQQALLSTIGPVYERGFIDQSYACCAGRGPHRALLQFLQWTRRYRYRLSLDIRRYFASIHQPTLLALFAHRLRDKDTLNLIEHLLHAGGNVYRSSLAQQVFDLVHDPIPLHCGLPLGGYLSHWSGALYLDGLDHFVKRTLKMQAYLRYMDDFSLFAHHSKDLEQARTAISDWLEQQRRLQLNPKKFDVYSTAQPCTYLGFRISRAGLLPGPKAKKRLQQRLRKATLTNPDQLARSLHAYQGMLLTIG